MKHFVNTSNGKKGFTLAELLIVVAIIGVLVAIAIPIFTTQLEKSREATDLANMRAAKAAAVAAYLDDNTSAGTYYFDAQKGVLTATAPSTGYGKGTAKVGDTNNVMYDSNGQCYDPSVSNAGKYITVTITDSNAADGTATIGLTWAGGSGGGSGSGSGSETVLGDTTSSYWIMVDSTKLYITATLWTEIQDWCVESWAEMTSLNLSIDTDLNEGSGGLRFNGSPIVAADDPYYDYLCWNITNNASYTTGTAPVSQFSFEITMNGTPLDITEYVYESGGEYWLSSMPSGFTSVYEERDSGTGWTEHYYVLKYNGNTVYEGSSPVEYSTDSGPEGYRMTQNGTYTTN